MGGTSWQPECRPKPVSWPTLALLLALLAVPAARADSQAGREFWFAWPETADATGSDPSYDLGAELVVLAVSGPVTVRVTGPGLSCDVTATPGSPALLRLDRASTMMDAADTPLARGVHLATTGCAPFAAFLRVPGSSSSVADDMGRLLPVGMLGTRYLPASYRGEANFVVCATQDGTRVRITDPHCSSPPELLLNRGEAVLHRCDASSDNHDISGTIVDATAPVAVLSASAFSRVIFQQLGGFGQVFWDWADVLLDAPWPEDLLGRAYAHAPFRQEGALAPGDLVRLMGGCPSADATIAEADGDTWTTTLAFEGAVFDAQAAAPTPSGYQMVNAGAEITADRPFQAVAFTVGGSRAGIGDPSMMILDPRERWEPVALAYIPPAYDGSLAILAPTAATSSVRVDGAIPAGAWAPAGANGAVSWLRLDDVAQGEHRVTCDQPIFVEVSGFSNRTDFEAGAFSTPAIALRADDLPTVRVVGAASCGVTCARDCVSLSVPGTWTSVTWDDGATGASRTWCPTATSDIEATLVAPGGCISIARAHRDVIGRADVPVISGPSEVCAGDCATLAATAGWAGYAWGSGATTPSTDVCPTAATIATVTTTDDVGCTATAQHAIGVIVPPTPGAATVATMEPCRRGLVVTWAPATWRPGSAGGVYNLFRRQGSCSPDADPAWTPLALGLTALAFTDTSARAGIAYTYRVQAEDAPASVECWPGAFARGPSASACAQPEAFQDPGDPDEPRLVSLSPYLRAAGYERSGASGPCTAVTFTWALAPAVDPATHVDAWRSEQPDALAPIATRVTGTSWRDADPTSSWLLFYRVLNATECGSVLEP